MGKAPACSGSTVGINRRTIVAAGFALAAGLARAAATDKLRPAGPIRLIVPHSTGTTPDIAARLLAPHFAAHMGQPCIVDNKAGASGILGYEAVMQAQPDGRTLMLTAASLMTIPMLYPKTNVDPLKGFQPIAMVCSANFALVVNPAVPVSSLSEFLRYAKRNPGRLSYGSPGAGTFHHLWMETLQSQAGVKMLHAPYKGAANALTDLLAGHVDAMFIPIHQAQLLGESGKLKMLGVISSARDAQLPYIPTLSEAGLPNFAGDAWYGLLGPKGLSAEWVDSYGAATATALRDPGARAAMTKQGLTIRTETATALHEVMLREHDNWHRLFHENKLTVRPQ